MDREKLRDIINESAERMNQKMIDNGYFDKMSAESRKNTAEKPETIFSEIFNLSIDMATTLSSTILLEVLDRMFSEGILTDNSDPSVIS